MKLWEKKKKNTLPWNTKNPAPRAPTKAKKFTGDTNLQTPATDNKPPETLAITAPNVAPELIPIIPGSASGFLKNNWKTAPLPPNKIPVTKTKRALGSLNFNMIILSNLLPSPNKAAKETFSAPKINAITKHKKTQINENNPIKNIFLQFFTYSLPHWFNDLLFFILKPRP